VNRRRLSSPLVLLAAACLWSGAAGCGRDGPGKGAAAVAGRYDASGALLSGSRRAIVRPNVVLVSLDTLRADAIESVGGEPPVMPKLAALAASSTRFVDAAASATWTAPSVATMLTSLWPWRHGVQGHFNSPPLVPSVTTLPEILRAAGYATHALTGGGFVSDSMGLGQGFDSLGEDWSVDDPHGRLTRALTHLDRSRPFLLFLHTYDAHEPYGRKYPPEGHDDPARVAAVNEYVKSLQARMPEPDSEVPPEEGRTLLLRLRTDPLMQQALFARFGRERMQRACFVYDRTVYPTSPDRKELEATLRARYRTGLVRLDEGLAAVVARLDAALPKDTVWIFTTDHGEAFGEHVNLGHGRYLYDELARTILFVRAPGRLPAGEVRGACGLVDVLPTVLDLAGLPTSPDFDGRSLLPLARGAGAGAGAGHPILAEEVRRDYEASHHTEIRLASARTDAAKWLATWRPADRSIEEEVYDLEADPGETTRLPKGEVSRFGKDFQDAVATMLERVRAYVPLPRGAGERK
jgi:arylsulfatase A-like enzyme